MFTFRQYRPNQKSDFLKSFPEESRAAAALLRDELRQLTFVFASVFHEPGGVVAGVRVEFETKDGRRPVWVEVMKGEPRVVLGR
jgi:hypothetical protein